VSLLVRERAYVPISHEQIAFSFMVAMTGPNCG
jgi:hypothetical protein